MIWMSNFDRQLSSSGRGIETNFKEKINGDGLQPLFKSNKLSMDLQNDNNFGNQTHTEKLRPSEGRSEKSDVFLF